MCSASTVLMHDNAILMTFKQMEISKLLCSNETAPVFRFQKRKKKSKRKIAGNLLLQLIVQIQVRKGVEHRHDDSRILLKHLFKGFNNSFVVLITDNLRQRSDNLFLQVNWANGKHLHQLVGEGIRINDEIKPPEVVNDKPSNIVFKRQRCSRIFWIYMKVLGKFLKEHILKV